MRLGLCDVDEQKWGHRCLTMAEQGGAAASSIKLLCRQGGI
jgi:hypothetical protein